VRARPTTACVAALLAVSIAACGAERAELPSATVAKDTPHKRQRFGSAGIAITLPDNALAARRKPPAVFRASLGQAYIAAFAYRRAEQLPRNARELQAARRRLVGEIHRRDRRFKLIRSRPTRVAGARAVEVVGDQRIARGRFRTRSLHAYKGSGEYVLDLLAPVADFDRVSRTFFDPAIRSLRLSGSIARRR
jgi:hypothetical protein